MIIILILQCFLLGCLACHCDKSQQKILVGVDSNPGCYKHNDTVHCQYLSDALLSGKELNNSCIIVYQQQYLYNGVPLSNISNMTICGYFPVTVYCRNISKEEIYDKDVGLSIQNSFNIRIDQITFQGCGFKHPLFYESRHAEPLFISAALYFYSSWNVTLSAVNFIGSLGYSAIFLESFQLQLISVIARDNIPIPLTIESEVSYGGGVFIGYLRKPNESPDMNIIHITGGKYEKNNSTKNGTSELTRKSDNEISLLGKGGGISLIFGESVRNNNVTINDVDFEMNSAYFGGGLYVFFGHHAINNIITCNICLFDRNQAREGGGIFVQGLPRDNDLRNRFEMIDCYFIQNNAASGGGFQYSQSGKSARRTLISIKDSKFEANVAYYASAAFIYKAILDVDGSIIDNHASESTGTVILYKTYANVYGKVIFSNNTNTALVLESTFLNIFNTLIFSDNSGNNGGAMALFGHSVIFFQRSVSVLNFIRNYAKNHGGALYVSVPGPNIKPPPDTCMQRYKCFFTSNSEPNNVTFVGNRAMSNEGNSIYASTLQNCCENGSDVGKIFPNFQFDDHRYAISTRPVEVDLFFKKQTIAPGIPQKFEVKLRDEMHNTVKATVNVFVTNVRLLSQSIAFVKDSGIIFSASGNQSETFDVTLVLTDTSSVSKILPNLTLATTCPVGYFYDRNRQICRCYKADKEHFIKGVAQCFSDHIYLYLDYWAAPLSNVTHRCPDGYCRPCSLDDSLTGAECLYKSDLQCHPSRNQTSPLCSQCLSSLSVHLKAGNCSDCSRTHVYKPILIEMLRFVMTILLIFILLVLNHYRYTSYINPVIYSYQVIAQVLPSDMSAVYYGIKLIVVIIGSSHQHEFFDHCYCDGLNDLNKHWIILLHTAQWIIGFAFAYLLFSCRYKEPDCDSFYRTFNFVYLISCCMVLKFCYLVLKYVKLDGTKHVFVYAAAEYFSDEHKPYFFVAVMLLFVLAIVFTIALVISMNRSCSMNYSCLILERPFRYGFKTKKEATNTEKARKSRACFSQFYVICAAVLLLIAIITDETFKLTLMTSMSLVFTLILVLFEPYEDDSMNYISILILGNTTIVFSILDGYFYLYRNGPIMLNVFLMVPLMILLVMLLHYLMETCRRRFPNLPRVPAFRGDTRPESLNIPWRIRMMSNTPETGNLL